MPLETARASPYQSSVPCKYNRKGLVCKCLLVIDMAFHIVQGGVDNDDKARIEKAISQCQWKPFSRASPYSAPRRVWPWSSGPCDCSMPQLPSPSPSLDRRRCVQPSADSCVEADWTKGL